MARKRSCSAPTRPRTVGTAQARLPRTGCADWRPFGNFYEITQIFQTSSKTRHSQLGQILGNVLSNGGKFGEDCDAIWVEHGLANLVTLVPQTFAGHPYFLHTERK